MPGLTQNAKFDFIIQLNRQFLFDVLDWYETAGGRKRRSADWLDLITDEDIARVMGCSRRWVRHLQRQGIFKLATDKTGKTIRGRYFLGPTVRRIAAIWRLQSLCGGAEFDIGLTTYREDTHVEC